MSRESFEATYIEVGPSAPPMIEIAQTSRIENSIPGIKFRHIAPKSEPNIPN